MRSVIVTFLFCILTSTILFGQIDIEDGLIGYWRCDEEIFVADIDTIWDYSGNGNHGIIGFFPESVAGICSTALEFDNGDYIEVPHSDILNMTDEISISAWINTSVIPTTSNRMILGKLQLWYNQPDISWRNYSLSLTPGMQIILGYYDLTETIENPLVTDVWYHIIATATNPTGIKQIYINSLPIGIGQVADSVNFGSVDNNLTMGATDYGSEHWAGMMDEIRLYDRVLTDDEVQYLYQYCPPSPIYYYLPGDVNMAEGNWPPRSWGNDVTYLTNYYRFGESFVSQCQYMIMPEYFWASADADGDCDLTGSDLLSLINNLRGLVSLEYCIDYPPEWETEEDLPETPPEGWPDCIETPLVSNKNTGNYTINQDRDTEVDIWLGNLDGSPDTVLIGDKLYVDVYMQTETPVYVANLHIPIATDDYYIVDHLSTTEGQVYDDLQDWVTTFFDDAEGSPPNQSGWSSQSFMGWARIPDPFEPYLNYATPTKILTFVFDTNSDPSLNGQTVDCLDIGEHSSGWPFFMGDSIGASDVGYDINVNIGQVCFIVDGYPYFPGDVNMYNGIWQPPRISKCLPRTSDYSLVRLQPPGS